MNEAGNTLDIFFFKVKFFSMNNQRSYANFVYSVIATQCAQKGQN